MRHVMISARGVSKRYRIGGPQRRTNSFREAMVEGLRDRLRRRSVSPPQSEFWALEDVSFDLDRGEVLGVIGRNGAGKSTLLKVLSRITEPTLGRVEMRGRIASLLEVGTGFHPELTGRENVYLNGTILGMRKREIDRKFDEIVEFAEVAQFVDTPVKRYSSGMYVRLAFAVAAHLEPEILVVDEVLAVGDAEFQKKCLGKMGDVAQQGRTVLFVSHNVAAVRAICSKGLLLSRGRVVAFGGAAEIIAQYTRDHAAPSVEALTFTPLGDRPQFTSLSLDTPTIEFGETVEVTAEIFAPNDTGVGIELEVRDERGAPIAYMSNAPMRGELVELKAGRSNKVKLQLGPMPLATGRYELFFWLIRPWTTNYHAPPAPLTFEVVHSDPYGVGFEFRQSYGRGAVTMPIVCKTL